MSSAPQATPGDHIWQLVCGLPHPDRSNRLLLMLTAFMDDSDMCGEGPIGILAGWLGASTLWADFSTDWHNEVLNFGNAHLAVFKPNTRDLKDERELARLRAAMAVLERYPLVGLIVVVPHAEHKAAFANVAQKKLRSPYYMALCGVVLMLTEYLDQRGIEAPINFVFDYQPGQTRAVLDGWESLLSTTPPQQRRMLGKGPPIFADDERILPLQAAHLLAWNMRRLASANGTPQFQFPWPEHIRCMHWVCTDEHIKMLSEGLALAPPNERRRQCDGEG